MINACLFSYSSHGLFRVYKHTKILDFLDGKVIIMHIHEVFLLSADLPSVCVYGFNGFATCYLDEYPKHFISLFIPTVQHAGYCCSSKPMLYIFPFFHYVYTASRHKTESSCDIVLVTHQVWRNSTASII